MNFVAADLGASGTRYVTDHGKIQLLPNNLYILPTGTVTSLELNSEELEASLELTIERLTPSNTTEDYAKFPVTFLAGKMAERYSVSYITPDINTHKHKQQINYISAIMAAAVSKIKFGLDDKILLALDVPPGELLAAKEAFKNELTGKYKVTFHKYMGGTTVEFEIIDVAVYAESVMAMASFFFNMNGVPKVENKDFMRGRVLSLDIGASTSDVAIIENGKFLDKTGRTIKTGGNVARGSFINYITMEEGYELPEADAEVAIAEGRLPMGNSYKEVGDIVNMAKRDLANQLMLPLRTYFSQLQIPIQSIRAIVVSGGGSMSGQYINDAGEVVKTSEPLSSYVTEALKTICNTVDVVPYGEDARFANVKGLFIRAKVLMAKMASTAAEAQPAPAQQTVQAQPVIQGVPVQNVQPAQSVRPQVVMTQAAQVIAQPVPVQNVQPTVQVQPQVTVGVAPAGTVPTI